MKYILLICCCTLLLQSTAQNKKIDSFLTALETNLKAMGTLAIVSEGKLMYSKGIGYTSPGRQPAAVNTVYRVGSVTKMYTAAMMMKLLEQGQTKMTTKLRRYYPLIPNAEKITISNLLGHTSGIFNITNDSLYQQWYTQPITQDAMIEKIMAYPPVFEPGSKKQYSNSNYILLGYLVTQLTGKSYQQNLDEIINSITGATHTRYGGKIDTANHEAISFAYNNRQWIALPETDMSVPHGAGAIVSTAAETALFAEALVTGKILNHEWTDSMLNIPKQMGYGLIKYNIDGETGYGHNGAINGFNSTVLYLPGKKTGICFLGNGMNYSIEEIINGALKLYFNQPYTIPTFKTVQLNDAQLEKLNGIYSSDKIPLKITISSKAGKLYAQATGQSEFALDAESPTIFSNGQFGIVLEFTADNAGRVNDMLLKQGGATLPFTKSLH
ncbi:MAG TPA: serine hydrolase [Ferruginibacter sp.]|nr:serine hydrolase [Ferruginibacter sp.]HMP21717.1 serine hydrolase [Ferruginibacter sp.]